MNAQPASYASVDATASSTAAEQRRLLIADDDDASRIALAFILGQRGFEVTQAGNGQEALGHLINSRFDVALLDIQMPVMDGLRTLMLMRRSDTARNTPVVVLSQHGDRDRITQCASLGVRDFVIKQSLDVEKLVTRLEAAMTIRPQASTAPEEPPHNAQQPDQHEPAIDQQAWKQRVMQIGRVPREQTMQALAATPPPMVLPRIVDELKTALTSKAASPEDIVQLVESEPSLLIGLIATANKSQETANEPLDVDTALRWVGNAATEQLVQEIGAHETRLTAGSRPWVLRWWAHTMAVAQFASEMAPLLELQRDEVWAAAMIHDIGRLALLCSPLADKVITCYELARNMVIPTTFAEQMLLGINHKQAGLDLCIRAKMPKTMIRICETHDMEDAARESLDDYSARMTAVVSAADQLAKAVGLGGLASDELLPLPEPILAHARQLPSMINAVQAEIETLLTWRLGEESPLGPAADTPLSGLTIGMLSEQADAANPYLLTLGRAGAAVTMYRDLSHLLSTKTTHDVLIVDQTRESVTRSLQTLRRLSAQETTGGIPTLLLARRSDDPDEVIREAGLDLTLYATPIRTNALLKAIRRLTGSQ